MKAIKAKSLIFDLGGVIIDLDMQRTIEQMALLGKTDPSFIKSAYLRHDVFKKYEKGEITDEEFRLFLRDLLKFEGEDAALDEAWNAMILDIPREKLALLKQLKPHYPLFLLSNTNEIHMRRVRERLIPHGTDSFDAYFHKQYYSHQVNRRKPDADIYEFVLDENQLRVEEVLFIDDNEENIKGAANLGIQTLHVDTPTTLMNFFDEEKY